MATWAFVLYIGDGPRQVWHQRLVLSGVALSGGKLFVICTPDRHVYAED